MTIAAAIAQKSSPRNQQTARPRRSSRLQVALPSTAPVGGGWGGSVTPPGAPTGSSSDCGCGPPEVNEVSVIAPGTCSSSGGGPRPPARGGGPRGGGRGGGGAGAR